MKRKLMLLLSVFSVLIVSLSAAVIFANAEGGELTIKTKSLPKGYYDMDYSGGVIQAEGGSGTYTFEVTGLPSGLSCDPGTGQITGKPTSRGVYTKIHATVTDSEGTTAEATLSCVIKPKLVNFTATDVTHTYDGTYYSVKVTPKDESLGLKENVDYVVTYSDYTTKSIKDAGSYPIIVKMKNPNYTAGSVTPPYMTIYGISDPEMFSVSVAPLTVVYDGSPKSMEEKVSVSPDDVEYEISYIGLNVSYHSKEPPVEIGEYLVVVNTTGRNYVPKTETTHLTILAPEFDFTLTDVPTVYDGSAHRPTVACSDPSIDGHYTVTYTNVSDEYAATETDLAEITEAGTYRVNVTFDDPHYHVGTITPSEITIAPHTLNFGVSAQKPYTGSPMQADIVPSFPAFTDYTVTYDDISTAEDEKATEVTELGEYNVSVTLNHEPLRNFVMGAIEPPTFQIVSDQIMIDLELSGNTKTYTGDALTLDIQPNITGFTGYTATYDDLSTAETETLTGVVNAGKYRVTIAIDDAHSEAYLLHDIQGSDELTIEPKPVIFEVNPRKVYAGTAVTADITPPEGFTDDMYTVTYDNTATAEIETDAEMNAAGTYQVTITESSGNYAISLTESVVTVLDQYTVGYGNSPYGLIMRGEGTEAEKTAAKQSFDATNQYEGVTYSPKAWEGGTNYDKDETAVFVRNLEDFKPSFTAYYVNDGSEVPMEAVTVTVKNVQRLQENGPAALDNPADCGDWIAVGSITYAEREAADYRSAVPGVYTVVYTYEEHDGTPVTTESKLIVTGREGDVNLDGDVNAADANLLLQSSGLPNHPIYLYRMCDVTMDGEVTEADAAAIEDRFGAPIVRYYQ